MSPAVTTLVVSERVTSTGEIDSATTTTSSTVLGFSRRRSTARTFADVDLGDDRGRLQVAEDGRDGIAPDREPRKPVPTIHAADGGTGPRRVDMPRGDGRIRDRT